MKGFRIAAARVESGDGDFEGSVRGPGDGGEGPLYVTKVVKDPPKGSRGLLDGGATNSLRTARSEEELQNCVKTQVSLALGHADLLLTPLGTLISADRVSPIVPMGVLAAELGCKVNWEGEVCEVVHPKRGRLPIVMVNRCPELCSQITEELIREIEDKRALMLHRALRLKAMSCGTAGPSSDSHAQVEDMLQWLRKLSPDCPEGVLARVPPVWKDDLCGDDVPLNRRVRRAVSRADKVVIHLFSGKTKAHDFGSLPSSVYILSIDLERGADILADGMYQYLLDLCASGKVVAVVGGPPCATFSILRERGEQDGGPQVLRDRSGVGRFGTQRRPLSRGETRLVDDHTVMIFRMFLLHHVAHEASEEGVLFALENPMDPQEYLQDEKNHVSLWAWPEICYLEREKGMFRASFSQKPLGHPVVKPTTMLINDWGLYLELHGRHGTSVSSPTQQHPDLQERLHLSKTWAKWATGLTQAIGRAMVKWVVTPALERQRIMQEEQAYIRTLSKNDLAFIEHCERDHLGYRRDCKTCLASSIRSHNHLRQRYQHRNAFSLNIDLIGPLTAGEDQLGKARHLLVGVLGVPLFKHGKPQPCSDPDVEDHPIPDQWEDDDVAGPFPEDHTDLFEEGLEAPVEENEVEASGLDPAWEERAKQWNDRWKAIISELTEPVEVVPLIFVEPIASKRAATTLRGLQRIYTRIRLLNYTVRRIHSDSGREFANTLLEKWALSRDIALTASVPSDPRSNGRVEGVVGRCKAGIRGLLIQSGLPHKCWPHLARQWGEQKLRWALQKLGAETPRRPLVPAGTLVTVKKKREWNRKTPWSSKTVQGTAVAPSVRVPNATVIRIQEDDDVRLYVAPVVYTHVKEPVRFVGTAHSADLLDDLPAPSRRVFGKHPGVLVPTRGVAPRGESANAHADARDGEGAASADARDGEGAALANAHADAPDGEGAASGNAHDDGAHDGHGGARGSGLDESKRARELEEVSGLVDQGVSLAHAVSSIQTNSSLKPNELLALDAWTPEQTERYAAHLLSLDRPPQRREIEDVLQHALQDFRAKTRAIDVTAKVCGARGWTLGFYVYGNKVGLTSRTRQMPNVVKLLNKYLKSLISSEDAPATWAALRVTLGMQACPHRDRNMKGSRNWLVPISRFGRGRLWLAEDQLQGLESTSQDVVEWDGRRGRFLCGDECTKGVWFDSSKPHAVEQADGDRIVIVAYTPRRLCKGQPQDLVALKELGFSLPQHVELAPTLTVAKAQFGRDPECFDISTDSEDDSVPGEWTDTGEPKHVDERVGRMVQLEREERKALAEELDRGLSCTTPGLLAELGEDLTLMKLLQEHDACESEVELGCSSLALCRLRSVERELEDLWCESEKTGLPQVRAVKVEPSSQMTSASPEEPLHVEGPFCDLRDGSVPGELSQLVHPNFGLDTPELVGKVAQPTPGALLQTRIVPQAEVWQNLEDCQPLTDEVVALKNVHRAVWAIGPEELKRLEQLAVVSVIPAKGIFTQKPITNRLRARVVGCGNFLENDAPAEDVAKGMCRSQELYAGGVDGVSVRLQTSVAAMNGWGNAVLDIKTAFLGAPLYQDNQGHALLSPRDLESGNLDFEMLVKKLRAVQGDKVKIVVVSPPKILVRLGLIEESEKWLVIKVLYGLAEAPRRWSAHRDLLLRQLFWEDAGRRFSLVQCEADANLWRVVSVQQPDSTQDVDASSKNPSPEIYTGNPQQEDEGLKLHGLLGVYVDDMLITADGDTTESLIRELRAIWSTSEPEVAEVGRPVRFCGFNLHRLTGGGYLLNQEDYVQDLLQRFSDIEGTSDVPCLKEEEPEPESPNPRQLKRAQALAGALQWITTRTRPDICFAVNKTAQLMSRFPSYATRYAENIIRYLRVTPKLGLVFRPLDDEKRFGKCEELTAPRSSGLLEVFADASFGPSSSKSQTGIVAVFCGSVVAWSSHRQSTTAQSSAEAEMYSSMDGVLMIEVLESLAAEISTAALRKLLYSDSMGCVSLFSAPAGAWRTRHLRLKAKSGREKLENQAFEMRHLAGRYMLADIATNSLQGQRHRELLSLLEMRDPESFVAPLEVRKLCGEDLLPHSSSFCRKDTLHKAMGVKILVLSVLLATVAAKLVITVEDSGDEDRLANILLAVSMLLAIVAGYLLRKWCAEKRVEGSEDPSEVRSLRVSTMRESEEDQWSVVENTAGNQEESEEVESPKGFRSRNLSPNLARRRILASAAEVGSGTQERSGLRESAAPGTSGLRESAAPGTSGLRESAAPEISGLRESLAPEISGLRESVAHDRKVAAGQKEGSSLGSKRVGSEKDEWIIDYDRSVLIRLHSCSRLYLLDPRKLKLPDQCQVSQLSGRRRSIIEYVDGSVPKSEILNDDFESARSRKLTRNWVGRTEFEIRTAVSTNSSSSVA